MELTEAVHTTQTQTGTEHRTKSEALVRGHFTQVLKVEIMKKTIEMECFDSNRKPRLFFSLLEGIECRPQGRR